MRVLIRRKRLRKFLIVGGTLAIGLIFIALVRVKEPPAIALWWATAAFLLWWLVKTLMSPQWFEVGHEGVRICDYKGAEQIINWSPKIIQLTTVQDSNFYWVCIQMNGKKLIEDDVDVKTFKELAEVVSQHQ